LPSGTFAPSLRVVVTPRPLIFAHRGASAECTENSLAAFRRALGWRVDGIELDVRTTRDGVPLVFHDADLRRLTGGRGRIAELTARDVRRHGLPNGEAIPRLRDVLRLTQGRAVVQIELKAGVALAPVLREVRAARAGEWVVLASFDPDLVRAAGQLAPEWPRMLITEGKRPPAALARQAAACGASGVSVDYRAVRGAAWVGFFRARGLPVWCWTVNSAAVARRLAGWGVAAILGDNPALLHREL
jgi:glycerophosphoryl diester phosphodiesterase